MHLFITYTLVSTIPSLPMHQLFAHPLTAPQPLLLWIIWIALHWTFMISALHINYTVPFFPPMFILLLVLAHLCLFYNHLATHDDRVLKQLSWWGLSSRQNAMLVTQTLLTEELAQTFSHLVQHTLTSPFDWAEGGERPAWPQTSAPHVCVGVSRAAETLGRWREKLQPPPLCDVHREGDRAWERFLKLFVPSTSSDITVKLVLNTIHRLKKTAIDTISALFSRTE